MTPEAILSIGTKMSDLAWAKIETAWKPDEAAGHRIDVRAGADRRLCPGTAYPVWNAWRSEVAARMKPTRRRLNIMSALATGWLPWGVDWRHGDQERISLPLCGREYILCCGHVLKEKEAQAFTDAGLLEAAPPEADHHRRPGLWITQAGIAWLREHWR